MKPCKCFGGCAINELAAGFYCQDLAGNAPDQRSRKYVPPSKPTEIKMVYIVTVRLGNGRDIIKVVRAKRLILKSQLREIAAAWYGVSTNSVFVL